ncbi:MAG: cysteine desulfurase [Rhodospirillaceae bacterium]|nr:MAG: cysteine desulfurase [Rhodospirillaceae bacterium]
MLATAVEHDSILRIPGVVTIPVDGRGVVDLAALKDLLAADPRPAVVAVMLANNETGVLQPVAEAAALVHAHGGQLHCDAVQAAGKIPVSFKTLGADSLALSAHKLGGPQGVGALVVHPEATPAARAFGGGQERRHRPGTENLAGIVGFGAAATAVDLPAMARRAQWRDALEAGIRAITPDVVVLGDGGARLPNTTYFAVLGLVGPLLVMALDLEGVAIAAGAACGSGKTEPSHVPTAMGCAPAVAKAAVRVSLGWNSRRGDHDVFLNAWARVIARAREA